MEKNYDIEFKSKIFNEYLNGQGGSKYLGKNIIFLLILLTLGYEYIRDRAIWLMILLIQEVEKKKKILIIRKDMKY